MSPNERLTVTTWNLQGSHGVDIEAAAAHLRSTGSDVVVLQEVQRRQARGLARALGARRLHWSFKHWPITTWPEGMAVLGLRRAPSRVRARALTARFRFANWRRRIFQIADLDNGPGLVLVNLHLTPHGPGGDAREREIRAVLARVPDDRPAVVAGDFNAEPGTSPLRIMEAAGYTTPEKGPTKWRGTPSDRLPERQIDYIWASPGLTAEDVLLPAPGDPGFAGLASLSDHLPVTVTLTGRTS